MTMLGRWDRYYHDLTEPRSYGDPVTYKVAQNFLADCPTVEDWGAGMGYFKTLRPDVVNVDGTDTVFTDIVADLTSYTSSVDGILLRHVLEHNHDWVSVLDNAVSSAQKKLCIILFTPLQPTTRQIAYNELLDVPDIAFCLQDVLDHLTGWKVAVLDYVTNTQYEEETIICAERQ